jgi:hypothetical protein
MNAPSLPEKQKRLTERLREIESQNALELRVILREVARIKRAYYKAIGRTNPKSTSDQKKIDE